jgi:hypothetical protein
MIMALPNDLLIMLSVKKSSKIENIMRTIIIKSNTFLNLIIR